MALQPQKLDKQNIENMLAITTIQEGLLFHHLMEPNGTAYFEQLLIEIDGPIDRDILNNHGRMSPNSMKCLEHCSDGRNSQDQYKLC